MDTSKYILVYVQKLKKYILIKSTTKEFIAKGTEVIWAFEANKLRLTKKLLRNMNLASKLDKESELLLSVA